MPLPQPSILPDPTPAIRVLPTPATPAPTAKPAAKAGGLNLGKLAGQKPKAEAKKDERPTLDAGPELLELADHYHQIKPEFDGLKGDVEHTRVAIVAQAFPLFLSLAMRQPDLSSVNLLGTKPETKLLVSIQNRYASTVEFTAGQEAMMQAIQREGEEADETLARFEANFDLGLSIGLKFSEVPEEKRQPLIDALLPIFEAQGLLGTDAVEVKQILKPKPGFHARRHTQFTFEENCAIQTILPATGMVKVTGLKKEAK